MWLSTAPKSSLTLAMAPIEAVPARPIGPCISGIPEAASVIGDHVLRDGLNTKRDCRMAFLRGHKRVLQQLQCGNRMHGNQASSQKKCLGGRLPESRQQHLQAASLQLQHLHVQLHLGSKYRTVALQQVLHLLLQPQVQQSGAVTAKMQSHICSVC